MTKTIPYASSLELSPELLHSPKRLRLPADHQTRITDGSLEFTAETPAGAGTTEAEKSRKDFLYALVQHGHAPVPVEGYEMEVSEFVEREPLARMGSAQEGDGEDDGGLAYVKYTPLTN